MKKFFIPFILLSAAPAMAEENIFCADRPGQTTPPCIVAPGHMMIETGITSWALASDATGRTDSFTFGDSILRVGVSQRLEVQLGWTPAGQMRTRDKTTNKVTKNFNSGDISLGFLYGLTVGNGPVALQGFVTLPTGKLPVGAGDWGAGIRLPVQLPLAEKIQLGLTPELDKKVNNSGSGRHTAYGGAASLGYTLTPALSISTDLSVFRDDDPTGAVTIAVAGLSLAWQVTENTQLDISGGAGLNNDSPDIQLQFGIARLF